jgi:hypothetical protein
VNGRGSRTEHQAACAVGGGKEEEEGEGGGRRGEEGEEGDAAAEGDESHHKSAGESLSKDGSGSDLESRKRHKHMSCSSSDAVKVRDALAKAKQAKVELKNLNKSHVRITKEHNVLAAKNDQLKCNIMEGKKVDTKAMQQQRVEQKDIMTKLRDTHKKALLDVKEESKVDKDMALDKQKRGESTSVLVLFPLFFMADLTSIQSDIRSQ